MKRYIQYKNILTIVISFILLLVLVILGPLLYVLNTVLYEKYFKIKNSFTVDRGVSKIILVDIDDESLEKIGTFPFSRSLYVEALQNLQEYSPAVIGFDILFLDPSTPSDDTAFIQKVSEYNNIVFWSAINSNRVVEEPFFETVSGYLPPRVNGTNNTVYSFFPGFIDKHAQSYEHFTLSILRKYYYHFSEEIDLLTPWRYSWDSYIFSDNLMYPLSSPSSDDILIHFVDPKLFTRISFSDTLSRESLAASWIDFSDAIILIWPAAEWFGDSFYTPNGREYGLNIHGHILSTLIQEKYMTYFDPWSEWGLIFFIIILSVYINLSVSMLFLFIGNIGIIVVFWFCIPLTLLIFSNLIFAHPAEIIFSLILAFSSANIVKYILENMNKKRLNSALSEYVWSSIADEILLEHGKVNLDGEKRELVCFFSDIEGFTHLSEVLNPAELVTFLRDYLSEMTHIIMQYWGHVDKFEWDAIMALWGAFSQYQSEDCIQACEAALLQQIATAKISKKYENIISHELAIRIWIHEWDAIIGNIGAAWKKMEFTALGDTVNLASRLEWVNKYYGTYICVSHEIHEATKEIFAYRFLDEIRVQGKTQAMKIYELLWYKKDISEEKFEHYMKFSRALWQYRKWNFSEALDIFMELSEAGDIPSGVFIDRCRNFQWNPPKDWDWVWTMEEK